MVVYIIYRLSRLKVNFPGRKPINPESSKITCKCRGETALLVSFYILSDLWALVIYLSWNGTRMGTSRDSPLEQWRHAWHVRSLLSWLTASHMSPFFIFKFLLQNYSMNLSAESSILLHEDTKQTWEDYYQ